MIYARVSGLLLLALLLATGQSQRACAEDAVGLRARLPVMRAPTSGKMVSTVSPHNPRASALDDLYFAPLADAAPNQTPEDSLEKSTTKAKSSCIRTSSIRSADVRDDSTIRLTVAKNKQIDMKLYGICPGLAFDGSFYYQPGPTMQLCARLDTIVARSGSRCLIDAFVPVAPRAKK